VSTQKTDRWHRKFNAPPEAIISHTPTGWTNEALMTKYGERLSERYHGQPLFLVLDVYERHRTEHLRERASELNITLCFVPAGGTSRFQPLDTRIFGELKARARHEFFQLAAQTGVLGATPQQAVEIRIDTRERISPQNLRKARAVE
jgi:hypothetical protein